MSTESDFWSRRKAKVREESAREDRLENEAREAQAREDLEALPDEEVLAKLDLPDPDSLGAGDDFSVFMERAVPERLRRRALRKLWLSNPLLANLDEMVDYGEDYTDSALVVENLQTAYQVGKGMLKHVLETERDEAAKNAEQQIADVDLPDDESGQASLDNTTESTTKVATASDESLDSDGLPETDFHASVDSEIRPAKRRMRFAFADEQENQQSAGLQRTE